MVLLRSVTLLYFTSGIDAVEAKAPTRPTQCHELVDAKIWTLLPDENAIAKSESAAQMGKAILLD
jgi:hypothetical protein